MFGGVEGVDIEKYDLKILNLTEIKSLNRIFRYNDSYERWFKHNKTLNGFSKIPFILITERFDGRNIRESLDGDILVITTKSMGNVNLTLFLDNYCCPNIDDICNLNYDVHIVIKWYDDKYMTSNLKSDAEEKQIITNKIIPCFKNITVDIFMLLKEIIIDDLAKFVTVKLIQTIFNN